MYDRGHGHVHLAGEDPKKKHHDLIPEDLTEDEKKYIYQNAEGDVIFTPLYEKYNDLFFKEIIQNTDILHRFESFDNTDVHERYMLNAAQFSAAKTADEGRMLQELVYGKDGKIRPWSDFRKDATEITDISQKTWLRVEFESCRQQAVAAQQFTDMAENADLYPYWVYRGVMDDKEREEHVEMEGLVFRIGDAEGDACFPPNDWNCRCDGEPVDGQYLEENKLTPQTPDQAKEHLEKNVGDEFRFNAAQVGMLPNDHSYFDTMPDANALDFENFGVEKPPGEEEVDTSSDE